MSNVWLLSDCPGLSLGSAILPAEQPWVGYLTSLICVLSLALCQRAAVGSGVFCAQSTDTCPCPEEARCKRHCHNQRQCLYFCSSAPLALLLYVVVSEMRGWHSRGEASRASGVRPPLLSSQHGKKALPV